MNAEQTWALKSGFSIMDVKVNTEDGQSIFEFLLMLPMLLGITMILVKLNTAIQISIVNQQYARSQALFLAFNSAIYPSLVKQQQRLVPFGMNQLVVGVSDNAITDQSNVPKATVQSIARSKKIQASDAPGEEPSERALVRIRDTVTLCTPTVVLNTPQGAKAILPLQSGQNGFQPAGESSLTEQVVFNNFCGGPIKYE